MNHRILPLVSTLLVGLTLAVDSGGVDFHHLQTVGWPFRMSQAGARSRGLGNAQVVAPLPVTSLLSSSTMMTRILSKKRLLRSTAAATALLLTPTIHSFALFPHSSPVSRLFASTTTDSSLLLHHTVYHQANSNSENTPVVFLHGLLGNSRNFASIARALSTQCVVRERTLVGVDLRHHGQSVDDTHTPLTYPLLAQDVLHFMDNQDISQAILIGHSMGGKVAQTLALEHGHRVAGLVVLDMAPVSYHKDKTWHDICHILRHMNDAPTPCNRQVLDAYLTPLVPDVNLRAFLLTNFQGDNWKIPVSTLVDSLDHLADFVVSDDAHYTGDAYFIAGGQSTFVRSQYLPAISQYFVNHLVTRIPQAGHWLHAEAPQDTTALLQQYLDR